MKSAFVILILVSTKICFAFPQMIRHGYTSCNTCHASPRGGGIMTDYGRALSKELLSTWSYEGEENWHSGLINNKKVPSWLKIGGDFRALQVHSKDDVATIGRFIRMQEQVEVGVQHKNTWFTVTAASDTLKESRPWYIPGFYMSTNITQELYIRAGKFVPRFGINNPEHTFSTRGPIGFGFQNERPALELFYSKQKWDMSVTASTGELKDGSEATGVYSQFNYSFGTKDKVGVSFEKKTEDNKALSIGLHALVGFTEKLYLITDSVIRKINSGLSTTETGLFHYAQLGYEIEKGLHLIVLEDIKKINLDTTGSTQSMFGLGLTFFPRPHIELQGVWTKRLNLANGSSEGDYAWFLMHYYL